MSEPINTHNEPLVITAQANLKGAELILEEQELILFKQWAIASCAKLIHRELFPLIVNCLGWLAEESALKLRISILGGGCHGFQYRFAFTTQKNNDDIVMEHMSPKQNDSKDQSKVTWLVDMISLNFLRGAVVDFKSDLQGERFIIRGLKAKTTCSCGSSFDIDPE